MASCKIAFVLIASLAASTFPALSQGSGGGAGSGAAGAGSASTGSGSGAGTGTANSSGPQNGTQDAPTGPQSATAKTVASEQKAAVNGTNTTSQPGAVGAPGVGVGHAANGLPIGSPGSGLGSPEQPVDGKIDSKK
jgi:hypothetical protein